MPELANYQKLVESSQSLAVQRLNDLRLRCVKEQKADYMSGTDTRFDFDGRIKALLQTIGYGPHWFRRVVLVGGSAGKGRVATRLHAIFNAKEASGLFVSPDVVCDSDAIYLNGHDTIEPKELESAFEHVLSKVEQADWYPGFGIPSYFELQLAAALVIFHNAGVKNVILEVGCGGMHDATNAVIHDVAVITNIETDHANLFGGREGLIQEKLGICPYGGDLFLGNVDADVLVKAHELTRAKRSNLHQIANRKKLADMVAITLGYPIPAHLDAVLLPARGDTLKLKEGAADLRLDGAHSPEKIAFMAKKLKRQGRIHNRTYFAVKESKDIVPMMPWLDQISDEIIVCEAESVRGQTMAVQKLKAIVEAHVSIPVRALEQSQFASYFIDDLQRPGFILVVGSFLINEAAIHALVKAASLESEDEHKKRGSYERTTTL